MKKQSLILVIIGLIIIVIATGYAIFKETIDIHGIAETGEHFDIEFYEIGQITKVGYIKDKTLPNDQIAQISLDRNVTVIMVSKLEYPGAYVKIPITIKNVGTIKAILNAINVTGNVNETSSPLRVTYLYENKKFEDLENIEKVIQVGETKVITVMVEWVEGTEATGQYENQLFTITLDYKQTR